MAFAWFLSLSFSVKHTHTHTLQALCGQEGMVSGEPEQDRHSCHLSEAYFNEKGPYIKK